MVESDYPLEEVRNLIKKIKEQDPEVGSLLEKSIVITEKGVVITKDKGKLNKIRSIFFS